VSIAQDDQQSPLSKSPTAWLIFALLLQVSAVVFWFASVVVPVGVLSTLSFVALAVAAKLAVRFQGTVFTVAVLACVTCALFYPGPLTSWAGAEPSKFIGPRVFAPLLQLIMFGMGMTLTFADFGRVLREPKPVLIGLVLQFSVMPLTALACVWLFGFEGEIAAGLILFGACSGGTASNVITFLARGNVALSVTMTCCSTLAALIMTPLVMEFFADAHLKMNPLAMSWSICKMSVAPVLIGLLVNRFIHDRVTWLLRWLPLTAMTAICVIIGLTVAMARDEMLQYGPLLFVAAVCHNAAGFSIGYAAARACRLNRIDCRTVAIEVGMQNGGMASTLAHTVLHSEAAALASAIEGPWSAVVGSGLASRWRSSNVADAPETSSATATPVSHDPCMGD
jgi:BASS family bile acid:Na+ symporter